MESPFAATSGPAVWVRLGRNTPPPLPPLPASFTNWGFSARPRGSALRGGRNLASPLPPPACLPPPSPRAQRRAGCAGEAQYVSIELNCCGRRLYAAAEHRSIISGSNQLCYILIEKSCSLYMELTLLTYLINDPINAREIRSRETFLLKSIMLHFN